MSSDRNGTRRFEERLLVELKQVVSEQAGRQPVTAVTPAAGFAARVRRPRLAAAAGLTAVGTTGAVALMLTVGGASAAAFSVEEQDDGMVRIEISDLRDGDELESALAEAGIPATVDYLPDGMMCRQPRFAMHGAPDDAHHGLLPGESGAVISEDGVTASAGGENSPEPNVDGEANEAPEAGLPAEGIPPGATSVEIGMGEDGTPYASFALNPADFQNGRSLVIETTGSEDVSSLSIAMGEGEVLPCEEIEVPAGQFPPGDGDAVSETEDVVEGHPGESSEGAQR
ncbi:MULTISPECIES: hypothetical protein [Actinoalloteichus]|uniref:Uncharacterized protein n=1 Tax=Actinoalloteichus fjordicus TaxID=1612552 RepID=A0AAC9L9N1_9PSEU|nr:MULTISPECIES: hypothetical protein [Actinoalloteichus]APU12909.1 hypothetical protein UA74_04150 [Actinoalloteichus fjordicus]APU18881.1 hypothetical protein UA75_04250 [Actinoalloteichus sp. GBA129-24]